MFIFFETSMVIYIFYCIIIVYILSSLIEEKLKNFIGRKQLYERFTSTSFK